VRGRPAADAGPPLLGSPLPMSRRFCPHADSPIRPRAVTFHSKAILGTRFSPDAGTARYSGLATMAGFEPSAEQCVMCTKITN
jgi:hypothetical protein